MAKRFVVSYYPRCGTEEVPHGYSFSDSGTIEEDQITKDMALPMWDILLAGGNATKQNAGYFVADVMKILEDFGCSSNSEKVLAVLNAKSREYWRTVYRSLESLRATLEWHERVAKGEGPQFEKCGVLVASTVALPERSSDISGEVMGSIWVFSDKQMISTDGRITYVFAQGIHSSLVYMIARMLDHDIPPLSMILIDAVESWAREQGVQAIRINPLDVMMKILVEKQGFMLLSRSSTPDFDYPRIEMSDDQLSPYLYRVFPYRNQVVKFLEIPDV